MSSQSSFIDRCTTLISDELFGRTYCATAVYKNRYIIAAGGYNASNEMMGSATIYDTKTNTHSPLPDIPQDFIPLGKCTGAISNGYFFVVSKSFASPMCRINLESRKAWELRSNIFTQGPQAVISNGDNLFCLGQSKSDFQIYHPQHNELSAFPQVTIPRKAHASAIIEDKIYVIGGYDSKHLRLLSSVYVFDIKTGSWRVGPRLPIPLANAEAVVCRRQIIVSGGIINQNDHIQPNKSMYVLNPRSKIWIEKKFVISPACVGNGCVAIGGRQIFSIGGSDILKGDSIASKYSIHGIDVKHVIPNWDVIGTHILLRRLIDDDRAVPMIRARKTRRRSEKVMNDEKIVHKLFTELHMDIFREVLLYLV